MEQKQGPRVVQRSALTYTAISLAAALLFMAATIVAGGYTPVARFGGAAWVFMLAMIVSMPVVTARYKGAERK